MLSLLKLWNLDSLIAEIWNCETKYQLMASNFIPYAVDKVMESITHEISFSDGWCYRPSFVWLLV